MTCYEALYHRKDDGMRPPLPAAVTDVAGSLISSQRLCMELYAKLTVRFPRNIRLRSSLPRNVPTMDELWRKPHRGMVIFATRCFYHRKTIHCAIESGLFGHNSATQVYATVESPITECTGPQTARNARAKRFIVL